MMGEVSRAFDERRHSEIEQTQRIPMRQS
jgi:hypothetical protein